MVQVHMPTNSITSKMYSSLSHCLQICPHMSSLALLLNWQGCTETSLLCDFILHNQSRLMSRMEKLEKSNHSFSRESNGVSQADTQSLDRHWGSGVFWVLQVHLFSHFWLFTHQERSANPTCNINGGKGEGELNTTMGSGKSHTEGVSTYPRRK